MVRLPRFLTRDVYDSISPADYRYWDSDVAKYLSENAFTRYLLQVELALVTVLNKRGMAPASAVEQVERATKQITTHQIYQEENRIKHDIRALVNLIRNRLTKKNKPFVHTPATSFDIRDTATSMRFRDVTTKVVIPELKKLERFLIELASREAETVEVGRSQDLASRLKNSKLSQRSSKASSQARLEPTMPPHSSSTIPRNSNVKSSRFSALNLPSTRPKSLRQSQ